MTELDGFTTHDRVLVTAPHPDDESIATGGVLQAARAAGATCRALILTDGDNNPWPQRWSEKRWHIGSADRARWGARRRAEALAALRVLGVAQNEVRCFGLPDLGLTPALMRGTPDVAGLLLGEIEAFRPTRVFLPALEDRHPDHSALHVLLRLALRRYSGSTPALLVFGVHGAANPADGVVLTLSEAQRQIKRAAITQHATQMQLSRRRFVGYARTREPFRVAAQSDQVDPRHPLQTCFGTHGEFVVTIDHARWHRSLRGQSLFIVIDRADRAPLRWQVALGDIARADVVDTAADRCVGQAKIERTAAATTVRIADGGAANCPERGAGWVKLGRSTPGLFVFDPTGWQTMA